ncbi:MAG: DUF721 domain-containing protein [Saprospirales bacterium]|nr:MAG: DUF721 domain-containing protein [Saprospirales bacterium]
MMKKSNEHLLGDMLKKISQSNKVEPGYNEFLIRKWWRESMGSIINENTKGIHLKNGNLFIKVESASLRSELSMSKPELLKKVNELLGRPVVEKIVVQ